MSTDFALSRLYVDLETMVDDLKDMRSRVIALEEAASKTHAQIENQAGRIDYARRLIAVLESKQREEGDQVSPEGRAKADEIATKILSPSVPAEDAEAEEEG